MRGVGTYLALIVLAVLVAVGTFYLLLYKHWVLDAVTWAPAAHAHTSWINKGGYRNRAGEWCCGEGDCFIVEPVRTLPNGYLIMAIGEYVPQAEAQPSPDGKFWRCHRPDGTRRCFFAPPPSM